MIKIKEVQTQSKDTRVVRARKENIDDFTAYQLEFIPNENSLNAYKQINCKVILEPQQGPNLISYAFELERGLYDVYISKVIGRNNSSVLLDEEKVKYSNPVRVGEPYIIQIKIEETSCYGVNGVRVRIKVKAEPNQETIKLSDEIMYYTIQGQDIPYYIPFSDSDRIDFFIQNINKYDLQFVITNPSFEIQNI